MQLGHAARIPHAGLGGPDGSVFYFLFFFSFLIIRSVGYFSFSRYDSLATCNHALSNRAQWYLLV